VELKKLGFVQKKVDEKHQGEVGDKIFVHYKSLHIAITVPEGTARGLFRDLEKTKKDIEGTKQKRPYW